MTEINFWFDPECPFTWKTSRWILEASKQTEIKINWKCFSLYLKNKDVLNESSLKNLYKSHKAIRVIEAVRLKLGEEKIEPIYTNVGSKIHDEGIHPDDAIIQTFEELNLKEILPSLEDTDIDSVIKKSMDEAIKLVGGDVGVPIIEFTEFKRAYFGPVISSLLTGEKALVMFNALKDMMSFSEFYELKRSRN